jgi:protein SCO1
MDEVTMMASRAGSARPACAPVTPDLPGPDQLAAVKRRGEPPGPAPAAARSRWLAAAAVIAAAIIGLAACGGAAQPGPAAKLAPPAALGGAEMNTPLPAAITTLPLTTAAGKTTTLAAYRGKIVMIAEFLTLCHELCPLISANTAQMAHQLQAAGLGSKVALLEISVDPQRDTPARLAAYQQLFGGPQPGWTLLRASPSGTAVLWRYFHGYYQRVPQAKGLANDWLTGKPLTYDVDHGNTVLFLSPDGNQRYALDAAAGTSGVKPPGKLLHFLDDEGDSDLYRPNPQDSWTVPQAMQVIGWLAGRNIPAGGR